jgi:hypothetical protein
MRSALILLTLATTALAQPAPQAPKDVAGSLNSIWRVEHGQFRALAEAFPEDKWNFAPTQGTFEGVRTFAQQVKHVACANFGFAREIRKEAVPPKCEDPDTVPGKTKAEIMRYYDDSVALLTDTINSTTAQNMLDRVEGRYAGPNSRLGIASVAIWHTADHYGQIVIYARMNGIVPPASR